MLRVCKKALFLSTSAMVYIPGLRLVESPFPECGNVFGFGELHYEFVLSSLPRLIYVFIPRETGIDP